MLKFTTKNGQNDIVINEASFRDAMVLKNVVMKNVNSDFLNGIDTSKITLANVLDIAIGMITNIDSSPEFETAIFKCLNGCLYNGNIKITAQLFDDKPELREDYYEIVAKCAEANLRPFFKSLVSELKTRFNQLKKDDQPQNVQQAKIE